MKNDKKIPPSNITLNTMKNDKKIPPTFFLCKQMPADNYSWELWARKHNWITAWSLTKQSL